jgi:carotenoid cleavage dioxygenase-like enzyme
MLEAGATKAARTNLAPILMECDAPFLKIVGELPRELNGTLYRNGPNPQFDVSGAHWFVGDGMLHAFHLEQGRPAIATAGSAPRNGRPSTIPAARCLAASAAGCPMRRPR